MATRRAVIWVLGVLVASFCGPLDVGANYWQGMNPGMSVTDGGDRDRLGRDLDLLTTEMPLSTTDVRICASTM